MEQKQQTEEDILQIIPQESLSSMQWDLKVAFIGYKFPIYKLLREPICLTDIDWEKYPDVAFWCENETIIQFSVNDLFAPYTNMLDIICFSFNRDGIKDHLKCAIIGYPGLAVAETMSFFGSLEQSGEAVLRFDNCCFSCSKVMNDKLLYMNRALFPFSANVDVLDYRFKAINVQPEEFKSLDIVPKDLDVWFTVYGNCTLGEMLTPFMNRVAELGHLERLSMSVDQFMSQTDSVSVTTAAEALIGVIKGNPKLTHLKLRIAEVVFCSLVQLGKFFHAIGEHKRLRSVTLELQTPRNQLEIDFFWQHLHAALSCNTNLAVYIYDDDELITNRTAIDEIYSYNYVYNRTTKLTKESASVRPWLLTMALTECASACFKDTAFLLSKHTDMLCEFIDGMNLDVFRD